MNTSELESIVFWCGFMDHVTLLYRRNVAIWHYLYPDALTHWSIVVALRMLVLVWLPKGTRNYLPKGSVSSYTSCQRAKVRDGWCHFGTDPCGTLVSPGNENA